MQKGRNHSKHPRLNMARKRANVDSVAGEHLAPKQSLGDVIDKLTILTRKIHFGEEDAYKEATYLKEGLKALGYPGELIIATIRLAQANFEVWNLENELRKGDEETLTRIGLEEIGRRAIKIRDYNKKRIKYKNDINHMQKDGFTEFKIKHRSQ